MIDRDATKTPTRGRRRDPNKREHIIRVGVAIFTEKGFHNTSVDDIVKTANVPKGSFAYYFGSKDAYAVAVIRCYADYFNRKLDRILGNNDLSPVERLAAFMEDAAAAMERFDFHRGCLVGNLGQELAGLDESFRAELQYTLRGWQRRVQDCLEEAKAKDQLRSDADLESFSQLFWYAWEGAVLGAKLEKSRSPLEQVKRSILLQLDALAADDGE